MKTASILSKKSNSADCLIINMRPVKTATSLFKGNHNIKTSNSSGEKATIINMFANKVINKKSKAEFTYILRQEDDKRLNINGVLRVYHMNEPIDIPVESLLGKWNNTHVGVTLISFNEKWSLKDGNENLIIRHQPLLQTVFQRFLKFVVA